MPGTGGKKTPISFHFIIKYYIFVCAWGCKYSPKFVRFSWVVYAQLLFRVNMNRVCDFIG